MGCMQGGMRTRQSNETATISVSETTAHTPIRTRMVGRMRHRIPRTDESRIHRIDEICIRAFP